MGFGKGKYNGGGSSYAWNMVIEEGGVIQFFTVEVILVDTVVGGMNTTGPSLNNVPDTTIVALLELLFLVSMILDGADMFLQHSVTGGELLASEEGEDGEDMLSSGVVLLHVVLLFTLMPCIVPM
jgi:hypothetical protein